LSREKLTDEENDTFLEGLGSDISGESMSDLLDQLICERDGFDLDELRAEHVVREGVRKEAEAYVGLASQAWPDLKWNWDFSTRAQRYVYDGISPPSFAANHPTGLRLGWVSVEHFDAKLSRFNRRDGLAELWKVGDQQKLAEAIAYSRQSRPLTPPMVAPLSTKEGQPPTEVYLVGGNHRYTVAKFSGLAEVPIYVDPEFAGVVAEIVSVRWVETS
jgi:hypothetical protein